VIQMGGGLLRFRFLLFVFWAHKVTSVQIFFLGQTCFVAHEALFKERAMPLLTLIFHTNFILFLFYKIITIHIYIYAAVKLM
jgi:hypothetical protein